MNLQTINENLGRVVISPEVIEVVASIAATETKGVHALQNNFASGNFEKFGKKYRGKGIKVDTKDDTISVSVYVSLFSSANVHKTAVNIQRNITNSIKNMTNFEVKEVNVHIINIKS